MKIKYCFFIFIFLLMVNESSAQTDKIRYPFYSSKLQLQDNSQIKGVIFQSTDSSVFLINQRYWKYIKGRQRNLTEIKKAFYEIGVTNYSKTEVAYADLAIAEIKKRKGPSNLRWIGMGGGIIWGAIIGASFGNMSQNGSVELPLVMVCGGLLGGVGYGVGSLFSIRIPKKIILKETQDKEWQKAMLKYSIFR